LKILLVVQSGSTLMTDRVRDGERSFVAHRLITIASDRSVEVGVKTVVSTLFCVLFGAVVAQGAVAPGLTVCESQSSGFTYQVTIGSPEANAAFAPAEVRTFVDKSTAIAGPENLVASKSSAAQHVVQLADSGGQVVMAIAITNTGMTAKYKRDESLICRNGARR
jgi:hypothetical protein